MDTLETAIDAVESARNVFNLIRAWVVVLSTAAIVGATAAVFAAVALSRSCSGPIDVASTTVTD